MVGIMVSLAQNIRSAELPPKAETKEERDARMAWWREARFGMFIHWGVYSVPAGTWQGKEIPGIGEWIMNTAKIPVADYRNFAKQFNPVKYDPDAWVRLAKEAGMKYIVITSKHHDGFALFDSKVTDWDAVDATPYGKDLLKPLAEACRKHGIRLGFYYSQAQDWNNPGGAAYGGHWDKAQDGSMDDYVRKIAAPQVKEILSNYGDIAVLWWDTPVDMTREQVQLLASLTKLQPRIITNNRLGNGIPGDTETPEQFIPATGFPGRDWETCMTMNDTWGYKSYDNNWKSTETLVRNLIDIASKGGNYLLNVGPTSEGLIPQPSVERLTEVGKWMKINGDAIYGTTPGPFKRLAFGRSTRKDGKLYLHVFAWPRDGKLNVPLTNNATKAYLLADPQKALMCISTEDSLEIQVPVDAPDKIASVVVLEIEGDPKVAQVIIRPQDDESIHLKASDAEIIGQTLTIEEYDGIPSLGYWTNPDDYVEWTVDNRHPGEYEIELDYALDPRSEGSRYRIECADQKIEGTLAATKSWMDFTTAKAGAIKIEKTGAVSIRLRAVEKPGEGVMDLRAIVLRSITPAAPVENPRR